MTTSPCIVSDVVLGAVIAVIGAIIAALIAAFIARAIKISEFRQAWINDLRTDMADYISKAHEWVDLYMACNRENKQEKKDEIHSKREKVKRDALRVFHRIQLRFNTHDKNAEALLTDLSDLLDHSKLTQNNEYSEWRHLSNEAVLKARRLLKKEWEVTKSLSSKIYRLRKRHDTK